MPKMISKSTTLAATLALALMASAPLYADAVIRHFALTSSMPAADATIEEAHMIHLTFTQVPKEEGRLIRLADPQGEQVELGDIHMGGEKMMAAHIEADHLGNGTYTVSWRGSGDDGHFVTGDYTFTLRATDADR
jgi:methionine-rich copper-binding protein CopC